MLKSGWGNTSLECTSYKLNLMKKKKLDHVDHACYSAQQVNAQMDTKMKHFTFLVGLTFHALSWS